MSDSMSFRELQDALGHTREGCRALFESTDPDTQFSHLDPDAIREKFSTLYSLDQWTNRYDCDAVDLDSEESCSDSTPLGKQRRRVEGSFSTRDAVGTSPTRMLAQLQTRGHSLEDLQLMLVEVLTVGRPMQKVNTALRKEVGILRRAQDPRLTAVAEALKLSEQKTVFAQQELSEVDSENAILKQLLREKEDRINWLLQREMRGFGNKDVPVEEDNPFATMGRRDFQKMYEQMLTLNSRIKDVVELEG